ncbi:MAG: hypothetical protein ACLR2E_04600 [Lachnospiraceae bacterium]
MSFKKVYYFTQDGSAATGWMEINGSWYYFFVNGVRVANRSIDGNYLGPNGKRVAEKQIESRHKIFCGDSRTMQLKKQLALLKPAMSINMAEDITGL